MKIISRNTVLKGRIPKHIAIIMDGNGRWAKSHFLPRVAGHKEGINSVREITRICGEIGVKHLTLYTFSKENWKRPKSEVNALMSLLLKTINIEVKDLHKNNVKFTIIGDLNSLPKGTKSGLQDGIELTKNNHGLNLCLALNYGSRQEMIKGIQLIAKKIILWKGTISAEHGIGSAKRDFLHLNRSSSELAAFRAIKTALDPNGILNPNVLLPPESP